jgi:hypothetical protein
MIVFFGISHLAWIQMNKHGKTETRIIITSSLFGSTWVNQLWIFLLLLIFHNFIIKAHCNLAYDSKD